MVISSRTPEGSPNRCPVCDTAVEIEPSDPADDAPCPNCGHLLWFRWEDAGDTVLVKARDGLFQSESWKTLVGQVSERPRVRLVLDFRAVRYLSSDDLSGLINLKKTLTSVRGKVALRNLHPDLHDVFKITRLDTVFDLEP